MAMSLFTYVFLLSLLISKAVTHAAAELLIYLPYFFKFQRNAVYYNNKNFVVMSS